MEDEHITVKWVRYEDGKPFNMVARLPSDMFNQFVEENCTLCRLARLVQEKEEEGDT